MGKWNSKLSPSAFADLRDIGTFTESELQIWYSAFLKDFPDGTVTKCEFKQIYGDRFPYGHPGPFTDHVFRIYDANSDGRIDFREFVTAMSLMNRGSVDQKLAWAFSLYDLDNNGFITKKEMLEIVKSLYKLMGDSVKLPGDENTPVKRVDKIFRLMDADGDGRISLTEFSDGAKGDASIAKVFDQFECSD